MIHQTTQCEAFPTLKGMNNVYHAKAQALAERLLVNAGQVADQPMKMEGTMQEESIARPLSEVSLLVVCFAGG